MNTKHTAEPWHIDGMRADGTCELSVGETTIAANIRIDYAARAALCVNACAPLDRPETQIESLRRLATECVQLRSHVRELTAALASSALMIEDMICQSDENLIDWAHTAARGHGHIRDHIDAARAALAKVGKP